MLDTIRLKKHQGNQFIKDIKNAPMRTQFRGFPIINSKLGELPNENCCPTNALICNDKEISIDMGK